MSTTGGGGIGSDIMGFFGYGFAKQAAKKANEVAELNAKLGNDLTNASNATEAAQGNLQRYMQSVNNNRRLTAMGDAEAQNTTNSLRTQDTQLAQGFSHDISNAEQTGNAVARQAAAGLGGDTADQINRTTDLRDSISSELYNERTGQQASDAVIRAGAIAHTAIGGLDGSIVPPQLNYNRQTAQLQSMPNEFTYKLGAVMNGISDFFTLKWGDTTSNANDGKAGTTGSQWSSAYNKAVNYVSGPSDAQMETDRENARFQSQADQNGVVNNDDDIDAGGGWNPGSDLSTSSDSSSWFNF